MDGHRDRKSQAAALAQLLGHDHPEEGVDAKAAVGGVVAEPEKPHLPQLVPDGTRDLAFGPPLRDERGHRSARNFASCIRNCSCSSVNMSYAMPLSFFDRLRVGLYQMYKGIL